MKIESLISKLRTLVHILRIQDYNNGMDRLSSMLADLAGDSNTMDKLISVFGKDAVMGCLSDINASLGNEDMIMAADLLETVCIPALESLIQHADSIHEGGYNVESTSSGWPTLMSDVSGQYLHSNIDPMWEAEELARSIYDPSKDEYIVWGLGLGYTALKLSESADGSVRIKVFEEDKQIIRLADKYGVGSLLEGKNIEVIFDERGKGFVNALGNSTNKGIFIHRPSVKKIKNLELRDALLKFYGEYESITHYSQILRRNYYRNNQNIGHNVDELRDAISGKEVVIVAAGPSLEDSREFLKESKNRRVIIAVGTVLKKLICDGLIPDYVCFLDPNPEIMKQIQGITEQSAPAVLGEATYWKVAEEYKGEKYLACMSNLEHMGRERLNPGCLYETGGSVTTLALDVAFKQNAKCIYLVGVDLAFKDGKTHAGGTKDSPMIDGGSTLLVRGNSGQMITTSEKWDKFRLWIEDQIAKYQHIPVYNLSKTGAYINGTMTV